MFLFTDSYKLITDYKSAKSGVARGVSDRDIATESRVETLNNLYSLLVKYTGIGQDIFYKVNEAKYNDYVLYDTPSGLPEDPFTPVQP